MPITVPRMQPQMHVLRQCLTFLIQYGLLLSIDHNESLQGLPGGGSSVDSKYTLFKLSEGVLSLSTTPTSDPFFRLYRMWLSVLQCINGPHLVPEQMPWSFVPQLPK